MTCRPPPGTKPGTLCILTRDGGHQCLGEWDGLAYVLRRPGTDAPRGTFVDIHVSAPSGCRCGWVFAGVQPEPPRPQTAQEIARREIQRIEGGYYGISTAPDILVAFLAIAGMPERP